MGTTGPRLTPFRRQPTVYNRPLSLGILLSFPQHDRLPCAPLSTCLDFLQILPQLCPEGPAQAQISPIILPETVMGEDDNQNDATLDEINDVYQPQGVEVQVFAEDVLKVVEEVSAPKLSIEFPNACSVVLTDI